MSVTPSYFHAVRREALDSWTALSRSEWGAAVYLLFNQLQSPHHVISELLQNADDAGATWASVKISGNTFVFSHDGEDFTEEQFRSLCRFGVSSKRRLRTIGFRGIGFKSTFSFGSPVTLRTPSLSVQFRSEAFTVPEWVSDSHQPSVTVIEIPLASEQLRSRAETEFDRWLSNPTPLLFFRTLRRMQIRDQTISLTELGPGPVAHSRWVRLSGREEHTVLHLSSPEENFPEGALDEISKERVVGDFADLNIRSCTVDIIVGGPVASGVYTVLPVDGKTSLHVSINAPFIQDPGRQQIKDPTRSATNYWLLERLGKLAASSMLGWLARNDLPIEDRVGAYDLLPETPEQQSEVLELASWVYVKAFRYAVGHSPFLLTTDGTLVDANKCVAIEPAVTGIWDTPTLLEILDRPGSKVLARQISSHHRHRLFPWAPFKELGPESLAYGLSKRERVPRPTDAALMTLWNYLSETLHTWQYRAERAENVQRLPIVPTEGSHHLVFADNVVPSAGMSILPPEDSTFLLGHLSLLDPGWTARLREARQIPASQRLQTEDQRRVQSAARVLAILGLERSVSPIELVRKASRSVFEHDPQQEEGIQLAVIAARLQANVDASFKFLCRDGAWRVGTDLVVEMDQPLNILLPDDWLETHAISHVYWSSLKSSEISTLRYWLKVSTPVSTFPQPTERHIPIRTDADMNEVYRQRGGKTPFKKRRKSTNYQLVDADFDQTHWRYWSNRADEDHLVWSRVLRHVIASQPDLTKGARIRQFDYFLNHDWLTPAWLHRLRTLPCVLDEFSNPSLPSELLRVTPQTAFLQGVDRFIHPDLDRPENAKFLDLLGVRTDATTSDEPLGRLRQLAGIENPPITHVARLFQALDKIVAQMPPAQLVELREIFRAEQLILAETGAWLTSLNVVQNPDSRVPGSIGLHPALRELGIDFWDRIDVPREPSLERVMEWVASLEVDETVRGEERALLVKILAAHGETVLRRTGCWMCIDGTWSRGSDIRWYTHEPGSSDRLHPHVRKQVADARMLPATTDPSTLFGNIPSLESSMESRVEAGGGSLAARPSWLDLLCLGLNHVIASTTSTADDTVTDSRDADISAEQRLRTAGWVHAVELSVVPYLDGVPAGHPGTRRAVWDDEHVYVSGTSASHHDDLVTVLARPFASRTLRQMIAACVDRDARWIREYMLSTFSFDPLLAPDPDSNNAGKHDEDTETISGQNGAAETFDTNAWTMQSEDGHSDEVDESPSDVDEPASPRRRSGGRMSLLEQYLRKAGFESAHATRFEHPDGRYVLMNDGAYHGVERDASDRRVAIYWVARKSLEDGFEIEADVWWLLERDAELVRIVLPTGRNEGEVRNLAEVREQADVYPASFRVRLVEARSSPWTMNHSE